LMVLALLGSLAHVNSASGQTPTTRPSEAKLLVLPFAPLNPSQNQEWLGRSIQQSILADLTAAAPGRLLSADVVSPDMHAAADLGRKAGANFVVQGSFITLPTAAGEGLRIMGEVVEVEGGHAVTSFKATGLYSEIFRLEDQVANQIRLRMSATGVLSSPLPPAPALNPALPPSPEAQAPLPQVNEYYQAYATPQSYGDPQAYYNYYYANPYTAGGYGYGYGTGLGFGGSFLFSGAYYAHGSNFSGFDRDRFGVHSNHHEGMSHSGGSTAHGSTGGGHAGHR
jgi:TolB-like protein